MFLAAIVLSVGCQSFKIISQASVDQQAAKSCQVYSAGMCEVAVQMFAAGTPDKDTVAAIQFVESAGVEAFPALLNHLGDKRRLPQGILCMRVSWEIRTEVGGRLYLR